MTERKNIFISDCGEFVAIRILGLQPSFDVWRHDGSEMWEGTRCIKVTGKKECYNPRRLYTEYHANPKKIVGGWTNMGHENRNGKWIEAFKLGLYDLETNQSFNVMFHTSLSSLAPFFRRRRKKEK